MINKKILFSSIFFLNFVLLGTLILPFSAHAATPVVTVRDSTYSATLINQSVPDPVSIPAGSSKTVVFTFKNTGTATWSSTGGRFISAHTMEPRERKSIFFASDWINAKQTGKISGTIKPGQTGKLTMTFKVPANTKPGEYTEKFYLAAENYSWVKNGYFFVKIKVTSAAPIPTPPASGSGGTTLPTPAPTETSSANRVFLNPKVVVASGGEAITLRFGYQNSGQSTWTSATVEQTGVINLADSTWVGRQTVFNRSLMVDKGSFWRDEFVFRTPAKAGSYEAKFKVSLKGTETSVATIIIPLTVTNNAPVGYIEPWADSVVTGYEFLTEAPRLTEEPRIRVGLWKEPTNNKAVVRSTEDDYQVLDANGVLGLLPINQVATLEFADGVYTLVTEGLSVSSTSYIRVQPINNPRAIIEITNYERKIAGKSSRNFNKYRGALELRQAKDQNNTLYIINDLRFEDYMVGMGENSNASPLEYLKAQAVAQRTYAYFVQTTDKHESRFFDVVAHTGDQLYLGAAFEPDMPRFIDAVNATRGLMVTYNNQVVITPYFGNSDGSTRSWTQVWGGSAKPWLVPVVATYDERDNKKMFGHGVGMSQRDAAIRAEEENLDWVQLIKYYYTGTELHKIY